MTTEIGNIPIPDVWRKQLPPKHWEEGKSAWAVAHSWHNAQDLPPEIRSIVGHGAKMLRMDPEYAVSLPGFFGASWCDVFACIEFSDPVPQEYVLVVEAKVEENFGKTIRNWYTDKDSKDSIENKNYRIAKMCEKLGIEYDYDRHKDFRYELFHTTFAALKSAEFWKAEGAIMLVQSFCPEHTGFDEFRKFFSLFECRSHMPLGVARTLYATPVREVQLDKGTPPAPDKLYKIQTPGGTPLFLGWVTCEMPMSSAS